MIRKFCAQHKIYEVYRSRFLSSSVTIPYPYQDDNLHVYFPWRSKTEVNRKWLDQIRSETSLVLYQNLFTGFMDLPSYPPYWENDFVLGSKEAFKMSISAIFHSFTIKLYPKSDSKPNPPSALSDPLIGGVKNEETITDENNNNFKDIDEIFDSKLADFYKDAISTCHRARYEVSYSLLEAEDPVCNFYESIFFLNRQKDNSNLVKRFSFGLFACAVPKPRSQNYDRNLAQYVTLRVWVDIRCKEIFMVKDSVTGQLLQGSPDPVMRTHQILLESVLHVDSDEFHWTVVDIDNWLNGNECVSVEVKNAESKEDSEDN